LPDIGEAPWYRAAACRSEEDVQLLPYTGINVEFRDVNCETPVLWF